VRSKIAFKLIMFVGLVTVFIIAVFAFIIIRSQYHAMIAQVEMNAGQLSNTVKSSLRHDMLLNHRESVHQIIDTISRQEDIDKIRIFNKEGIIMTSSTPGDVGNGIDKSGEACFACHTLDRPLERLTISERTRIFTGARQVRYLGIINPIYNEPSCWTAACHVHQSDQTVLGVLDVTLPLEAVDRQMKAHEIKMILLAACVFLGISAVLWFFVQRMVARPARRLVEATQGVTDGNLDIKVAVDTRDELGCLGQSFNEMTRKLSDVHRQLNQADKLASIGRLAAGVAHEINNPLTGVLTFSSMLLKQARDNPAMAKDLEIIVRETKRCREIVKSLLNFARQMPANRSWVNLNEIMDWSLGLAANHLNLHNIPVRKDLAPDLPLVYADPNQMQQVFINLLVNAVDAMSDREGEIRIHTLTRPKGRDREVVVEITDTGSGIAPELLPRIFEPFYSTKGPKGTGLGLAVVWGIIDKQGGSIQVRSEVDKFTTFTIVLPVQEPEDSRSPPGQKAAPDYA
jgi:two-component system, NtrC family, sensor kinase